MMISLLFVANNITMLASFIALLTFFFFLCLLTSITKKRKSLLLPPGPQGIPLLGNLPFLTSNLHHCFSEYSKTYGPIMKLKLGSKLVIVVSSPELAKEVYKDNDIIFSNHDQPIAAKVISYGGSNLVRCPYGPTWKMMHKIFLHELLNSKNLDAISYRRQREVRQMVKGLYDSRGKVVNVGEVAFATFLNLLTSMLWGGTLEGNGGEFRRKVTETVDLLGRPNLSDFLPMLARFDLQGIERGIKKRVSWLDNVYDSIIEDRMKKKNDGALNDDFLSILLKIDWNDSSTPLTVANLKGLIMNIMVGGTSVTSTTVEWVMAELMHRPTIKQKVQTELDKVIGTNQVATESHISKLHYLNATIKETLRLHAVVPLLVPRVPSQPCKVGGYLIPNEARVVTNVWAIHMDPTVWESPTEFKPERFLGLKKVEEFRFFPFGSGRRRCAGLPLVDRMLPLVVAAMVRDFDWSLPEGVEFDLCEKAGATLTKEKPVFAVPMPRVEVCKVYGFECVGSVD